MTKKDSPSKWGLKKVDGPKLTYLKSLAIVDVYPADLSDDEVSCLCLHRVRLVVVLVVKVHLHIVHLVDKNQDMK